MRASLRFAMKSRCSSNGTCLRHRPDRIDAEGASFEDNTINIAGALHALVERADQRALIVLNSACVWTEPRLAWILPSKLVVVDFPELPVTPMKVALLGARSPRQIAATANRYPR
ncbi:hypothetical protein [Mesorhizobium sp.]|uniref:hypothetical protein n=1 Tax=Mesorhizobium sp. TaxID=1871066 RepID=UPI000FE2AF2B|nr:hypothetical protein [Mesorhizobium sp.]RWA76301.1 MAG: hypothetical protein EOQ28_05510 [Mesorhizobium sp.]RWC03995.1 MAG: hypothetical protein EOQ57_06300 [Mesorhizobium sp.]RWG90691.1 MAG: hypothetical protein EOQ70_03020 [Mesorhizobium sp.]RWK07659.1 MAG: hypothetical protein EOR39_21865 [Mesorhizobium sp.]RWK21365.1 MAG: hypothetical protein EOR41_05330 [Mesorhizobium sp.]